MNINNSKAKLHLFQIRNDEIVKISPLSLCCTINEGNENNKMSVGGDANHVRSIYGAGTEQVPTWLCKQNEENRNKKVMTIAVFVTKRQFIARKRERVRC